MYRGGGRTVIEKSLLLERMPVAALVISPAQYDAVIFDLDGVVTDTASVPPSKPDPAVFLEAARRLEVTPDRAVVVEDALAGVAAGRRGGFGLVIGVDRTGHPDELRVAGADLVVKDLAEVTLPI
jgi:alpha,alpha-trehalase